MTKCKFKNFVNRSQINIFREIIDKSKKWVEEERVIQQMEVIHCNGFSDRLHEPYISVYSNSLFLKILAHITPIIEGATYKASQAQFSLLTHLDLVSS